MIVTEQFFKAKKDKHLNALVVAHRYNRTYMYLCISEPKKYEAGTEHIFIETDTKFTITNYSPCAPATGEYTGSTDYILFHLSTGSYDGIGHIQTFLNAIKKNSDVSFRIVAYNGSDYYNARNLVSHQLYGIIDGNRYLLENYVGDISINSPVRPFA